MPNVNQLHPLLLEYPSAVIPTAFHLDQTLIMHSSEPLIDVFTLS